METLKNKIMLLLLATSLSACGEPSKPSGSLKVDTEVDSAVKTLCITYVKTPWYAWKGLVVSKMRKSMPEYQKVKGLRQKFYSLTPDHNFFGGIYLFQTETGANSWFDQAWFNRTQNKYGEKGKVDQYQIVKVTEFAKPTNTKGDFIAVVAYASEPSASDEGLLKVITLIDNQGKECYLTLWLDKKSQEKFFAFKKVTSQIFEVPILLFNQ